MILAGGTKRENQEWKELGWEKNQEGEWILPGVSPFPGPGSTGYPSDILGFFFPPETPLQGLANHLKITKEQGK